MPRQSKLKEIQAPDEIPAFSDEAEEAEFWSTHSLGKGMLEQMVPMANDMLPRAGGGHLARSERRVPDSSLRSECNKLGGRAR